jgi:hypothetical protein
LEEEEPKEITVTWVEPAMETEKGKEETSENANPSEPK